MDLDIPTWTAFFVALSVPLVALIRNCDWPDQVVFLLALITVAACYTVGQWFDQRLRWPLDPAFLTGLLTAFGGQQVIFQSLKGSKFLDTLASFEAHTPTPRPSRHAAGVSGSATPAALDRGATPPTPDVEARLAQIARERQMLDDRERRLRGGGA
jgi:hypothetical protein